MSKANYYNANLEAKEFDVIADHKDGTITIGTISENPEAGGKPVNTVVVSKVKVSDSPKAGHATLVTKEQEKAVADAAVAAKHESEKQAKVAEKQAAADDVVAKAEAEKAARTARIANR